MSEDSKNSVTSFRYLTYGEKFETMAFAGVTPKVGLTKRESYIPKLNAQGEAVTDAAGNIIREQVASRSSNQHFESKSLVRIVDLISEGPIEGFCSNNGETISYFYGDEKGHENILQSVYFDGTKVLNPEIGTLNYRKVGIDFRPGMGNQPPLSTDYKFASQTIPIGTRLTPAPFYEFGAIAGFGGKTTAKGALLRNSKDGASEGMEFIANWKNQYEDISKGSVKSVRDVHSRFKILESYLEPVTHTIQNPLVEEVTVNIKIHVLSRLKVGKRSSEQVGAECSFLIYVGNESGSFDPAFPVLCEGSPGQDASDEETQAKNEGGKGKFLVYNETGGYFVRIARGLATSDYVFETKFHLPPNFRQENRVIKVFRLERDLGYDAEDPQVETSLESIVESIPYKLRYPYSAVIGTTLDSTAMSRIPKREFDLKLLKVKVPSNYIPDTKQYFGNWSGRFKEYVAVLDPLLTKELKVKRSLATVTNRAKSDGTKQIKISTSVKKYGSGSILFPTASALTTSEDWAKRISIHNKNYICPIEKDDGPKKVLRVGDFGFQNFTIEFYIKVTTDNLVKTYSNGSGTTVTSSSGKAGFYKTIISSSEGQVPCTGGNESDEGRNDNELYIHPAQRQELNYSSGIKEHGSVAIAGNWMVEIGTESGGEVGQIFFRYFTYGAYYRPVAKNWSQASADYERVGVLDTDGKPTVASQVVLKSTTSVADDEWHHVAITREGNRFNVWIDGNDRTDSASTSTYDGDIRGFAYRSGSQKNTGVIEVGNDRSLKRSPDDVGLHSSFEGYLDYIHIIRKCKYTKSGFNTNPEKISDLIPNEQETVALITGDGQPDDGTKLKDYNPVLVLPKEATSFIENFGSTYLQWTDNPAWIFYDLVTNKRYGLGKYGINPDFINKWNMYELGKYCDELVKTGWPSRYPHRNFQVVTDGTGDALSAGEIYIKINGFERQSDFLREFPRFSTIAIFDLDDAARPVKRVIEYIKEDGEVKSTDDDAKYHSWIGENGTDKPGSAVIKLLRPVSIEECFLLNQQLQNEIINQQYKRELIAGGARTYRDSSVSPKKIIYDRYGNFEKNKSSEKFTSLPGDQQILDFFFDGQKINSTSASGKVAAEFAKSREILEPRFTANMYLTTAVDAFKVLNDLSSVFLGLTYIVGGKVFASFDKPRDPIMNFTNSNIKNGSFTYAGSPKTSRFTTAIVRYVDKYENFKPKVEYVEDAAGIIKYGLIEKELIAFACTSRGQARRLGKWFLFSAQLETDSVQFTTGKEASYLRPGDVIKIMDKNRSRKRYGGRITSVSNDRREVTLDAAVDENVVGQIITIAIPSSFQTEETLDQTAINKDGVSDGDLKDLRKPQIKEFKVSSINTNNKVPNQKTVLTLSELNGENAENVGSIKTGAIWILQNKDPNLKIQEILYRVMNIEEESSMEYKVSCLEYNKTKFKASEDDSDSDKTNVTALGIGGSGKIERQFQAAATDDSAQPGKEPVDYSKYQVSNVEASLTFYSQKNSTGNTVKVTWGLPQTKATDTDSLLKKWRISYSLLIPGQEPKESYRIMDAIDKNGQDVTSAVVFLPGIKGYETNSALLNAYNTQQGIAYNVQVIALVGNDNKNLKPVEPTSISEFTFKKDTGG